MQLRRELVRLTLVIESVALTWVLKQPAGWVSAALLTVNYGTLAAVFLTTTLLVISASTMLEKGTVKMVKHCLADFVVAFIANITSAVAVAA